MWLLGSSERKLMQSCFNAKHDNVLYVYMQLLRYYGWLPRCCYGIQHVTMQLLDSNAFLFMQNML